MSPLKKRYPTFDCDAHVTEMTDIWDYLAAGEKELVKQSFWPMGNHVLVNASRMYAGNWAHGRSGTTHGFPTDGRRRPSVVEVAGPGLNKPTIRKLYSMRLTEEQCDYTDHKGAREPLARVADMDLMGIDQVVVIPLQMFSAFLFVENVNAAAAVARAYNKWIHDWCSKAPDRLYGAAVLPVHNAVLAAEELRQVAQAGFKVAMVRPVDVAGRYPNQPAYEPLWRAFEETGLVVGMHSLVTGTNALNPTGQQWSPGMFLDRAVNPKQMAGASQTMSFIHEAMTWVANVLLSGFLDKYPAMRMAIMESNASWLPMLLEELDRAAGLYASQRWVKLTDLPTEAFFERCFIAFEGDETPVFRQYRFFENIGIWSSDVYHHDGADAWTAIREMEKLEVPEAVQAKLMGANARRMYRIEPGLFTTQEQASYPRPDWYPKKEDLDREFAPRMVRA